MSRSLFMITALLFSSVLFGKNNATCPPDKTITVVVDAKQGIFIGRDTVDAETMPAILTERLWKSYLGTGRMYDKIKVQTVGEVLMGTRGAVYDAIQEAQKQTLKRVCLQLYKKLFEELSAARQARLKLKFKVLFQETF